jgi:hypothetical protein
MPRWPRVRLTREITVLRSELARDKRHALRVGDHGHPHPGGIEALRNHIAAEPARLRGDSAGVVDRERCSSGSVGAFS